MPLVIMPDGVTVEFPNDMPREQIRNLIASKFPELAKPQGPDNKPGTALGRGLSRSVDITQQGFGSALEGLGRVTGIGGLEEYGADVAARNTKELADTDPTTRQDVEGVGTGLSYAGETIGEAAVPMGIGIGAGALTGAAVGSLAGPLGTIAGFGVGAAGAALSQIPLFYGQNRETQKESVEKGIIPEVSESAAFLTSIPQAVLEGIADKILPGGGKFITKAGAGLFTRGAAGAATGVVTEVPTEVGQQVLERYQAGLPLDDADAISEYTDAAVGAGVVGGTLGGASGAIRKKKAVPDEEIRGEDVLTDEERALRAVVPPAEEPGGTEEVVAGEAPIGSAESFAAYRRRQAAAKVDIPVADEEAGDVEEDVVTRTGKTKDFDKNKVEIVDGVPVVDTEEMIAGQPGVAAEGLARDFPKVKPTTTTPTTAALSAPTAPSYAAHPLAGLMKGMNPELFDAFHAGALSGVDATDTKPTLPEGLSPDMQKAYKKGFTGGLNISSSKVDALKGFSSQALAPIAAAPLEETEKTKDRRSERDLTPLVNTASVLKSLNKIVFQQTVLPGNMRSVTKRITDYADEALNYIGTYTGMQDIKSPYKVPYTDITAWEEKQKSVGLEPNTRAVYDFNSWSTANPKASSEQKQRKWEDVKFRSKDNVSEDETLASDFLPEEYTKQLPNLPEWKEFVETNERIPVKNDVQALARDAAIALGQGEFDNAAVMLFALKEVASSPAGYMAEHNRDNSKQKQGSTNLPGRRKYMLSAETQTLLDEIKKRLAVQKKKERKAFTGPKAQAAADAREAAIKPKPGTKKKKGPVVTRPEDAVLGNNPKLPPAETAKKYGLSGGEAAEYVGKTQALDKEQAAKGEQGVTRKTLAEQGQRRSLHIADGTGTLTSAGTEGEVKGVFTARFKKSRDAIAVELVKRLKAVNLGHISLEVADLLYHPRGTISGIADGNAIAVALGALDKNSKYFLVDPLETLNHEIIHVLRSLDLFSAKEWSVLTRRAKSEWMGRYKIWKNYKNLSKEEQLEEVIAEMFRDFAAGRFKDGFVARIAKKIKNFFSALGVSFKNNGFDSVEDIFKKVDTGEVSTRPGTGKVRKGTRQQKAGQDAVDEIEVALDSRNKDEFLERFKDRYNAMTVGTLEKVLYAFTTHDIKRRFGDRLPFIGSLITQFQQMAALRLKGMTELDTEVTPWIEFSKKYPKGARILSSLINRSTVDGVNISKYDTLKAALDGDKQLGKISSSDIDSILEREAAIKNIWGLRNKLMAFGPEGMQIYESALEYNKKAFDVQYKGMEKYVNGLTLSAEDKEKALTLLRTQFAKAHEIDVYATLARFGGHWLRVGVDGPFQMFESATARNEADRHWKTWLKDNKSSEKVYAGNKTELRTAVLNKSALLKQVFDLIDKEGSSDTEALKDSIMQMHLSSLPGADIRKNIMRRKGTPGYSGDALRAFIGHHTTATNQLAKLSFSNEMREEISKAYRAYTPSKEDDTQGAAVGSDEVLSRQEELRRKAVIEHMAKLVDKELTYDEFSGTAMDAFARWGNKAVFYFMMTAPKSAIAQMTSIPIIGLPVLAARYGVGKASKVLLSYANVLNPALGIRSKEGEISQPSVLKSRRFKKLPKKLQDLMAATFEKANIDHNLLMDTYTSDMTQRARKSTDVSNSLTTAALNHTESILSGAFHHMERMTREIMLAATVELEYNKNNDVSLDDAAEAGVDAVHTALFQYAEYNKPLGMRLNPMMRTATQFMTYPVQVTSYLVRNAYSSLPRVGDKATRKEARIQLFGTLGMTVLFSGVAGLPMYSLLMGVINGTLNALRGDDEEEDNALVDSDFQLWFETVFIPRYFGSGVSGRAVRLGLIPALTDMNIGSSTSMDGMFFRGDNPSKDTEGALRQFAYDVGLGAFGSMGSQLASAYDDIEEGNLQRGIEKALPAFFRGPAKAFRYYTEGNMTRDGKIIKEKELYGLGTLAGQMLNISSTEVDAVTRTVFAVKRNETLMNAERSKIFNDFDTADREEDDAAEAKAQARRERFDRKYPLNKITEEALASSREGKRTDRNESVGGASLSSPENLSFLEELLSNQ